MFNVLTDDFDKSRICARWLPRILPDNHKKDKCRQVKLSLRDKNVIFSTVRLGCAACIEIVILPIILVCKYALC
jgi:hypothetical protein